MSTDLAAVLTALAAALADDPVIGVDGSEDGHLRAVAVNGDWLPVPTPGAMVLVTETQRVVAGGAENVTAAIEVRLAIPGPTADPTANPPVDPASGDMPGIIALVEQVRRVLIQHRTLSGGNPPKALITASAPKGETYEVQLFKDYGWYQTAIVRWQATWLQSRTFADVPLVSSRSLRVVRLERDTGEPAAGGTETQPPEDA